MPHQHIDKDIGLSNSSITSIYMDSFDYTWMGSWDGLNRYDGSSIKTYKPEAFQKGFISNNVIRKLFEDKFGNLWVITHKGINRYDRSTDSFESYFDDMKDIPFLENNMRTTLDADSVLWISIIGKGICKYDNKTDRFIDVPFEGIDKEWTKTVIGIGSENGLLYLLGADGKLFCFLNSKIVFQKQLALESIGRIQYFFYLGKKYYMAIGMEEGNVLIYSLTDLSLKPQKLNLSGNPISSISTNLNNSALWIGTELGDLFYISSKNGKFVSSNRNSNFPLLSNENRKILSVTETKQDILWVGTDGDGAFKFLTRPRPFFSIIPSTSDQSGISNSIVRSVYEDKYETLFVGTRGGGLNIIQKGKPAEVLNTTKGLSNNTVLSLKKDKKENLWIGLDGEGIDMIEAGTGKIFHFPRDFENSKDINFNYVYSICIDAYGSLWLGTSGDGVIHMKISRDRYGKYHLDEFKQVTHSDSDTVLSLNSNVIYSIVEETPNILWFGTRGAGVYRYNTLTEKIEEHLHSGSAEKKRLTNDDVLNLFISEDDQLWIGTSGGMNQISLQTKPYTTLHYTNREGLHNNTIHSILQDPNGMIWMSTNNGLVMFDPDKNIFKNFDIQDGLHNSEFTDGASFRSINSEKLFFGGINGLDIIYPTQLDTIRDFPRLTISEFYVFNQLITPGHSSNILKEPIDNANEIILNYDQNFISFHFTALNYWNKQRTEYAYFLENFDKEWNMIGNQSSVNLTNIPPGSYLLYLNSTNESGIWNSQPREIAIVVNPPFWKTNWAYFIYFLIFIGVQIGIIFFIRQKAIRKRARTINKLKVLQLKELNDYKLQFFTNIAHEFRTPLTLILGPVSTLMNKSSDLLDKFHLKTIYNNSLRLNKLIEELIQFRSIESGKEKAEVTHIDLVSFSQNIVDTFDQHAKDHELNLEFINDSIEFYGWVDIKKLESILINLISNAIKYNKAGGFVEVILKKSEKNATYEIKDTGIGILESDKIRIFERFFHNPASKENHGKIAMSAGIGLSLTKSLIELHNGKISLESKVGKGSIFTLTLPILRENYELEGHYEEDTLIKSYLKEKVQQEFYHLNNKVLSAIDSPIATKSSSVYSILVVDDHKEITVLLQSLLSDKYTVFTAYSSEEALKLLDAKKIDLVISDVLMPGMDGLSLCKVLKENIETTHIPVILLTAKAEIEDKIQGLQMGADSYIPKPFYPEHLFIRIEELIKNREQIKKRFESFTEIELEKFSTGLSKKDDEFFIRITQCIEKHLSESEFSADIIADEVGMSKASLYKKVKATVGLTPHGLIKKYRLRKAAELLKTSNLSVSEIIYETGFNSRSYFYKSFNEMYHCHPKDYDNVKVS